jgi:hypothetical protein
MRRIKITAGGVSLEAELLDTATADAKSESRYGKRIVPSLP